jgi:hypothetical protein
MKWEAFAAIFAMIAIGGCARPIGTGEVIDRYRRAECIPVAYDNPTLPYPVKVWHYILNTPKGTTVKIMGQAIPGGRIELVYLPNDGGGITADAGDYIYPADVRFDRTSEHVYVKASGRPAAFGGEQTWLFKLDLQQRRQVQKVRVEPRVLPEECPVSNPN